MTSIVTLALIATAVVAAGLTWVLAAAEATARLVPRARLRRLQETGARGAASLDWIAEREDRTSSVHALVSGASFGALALIATWMLLRAFPGLPGFPAGGIGIALSAALLFTLGEALPRALALANPESVGLGVAPVARQVVAVVYPVSRALSSVWVRAVRLISREVSISDPWADDALKPGEASENGGDGPSDLEEDEQLIEAVEDFAEKVVREVMVPRTDMICLASDASVEDAVKVVREAGFSRIPLYGEDLDDIVGVVYAKDLLACLDAEGCRTDLRAMAREAFFVPETKPADELLREMRRLSHIAIVADEYGGTAGLVTIEDLLEELVGEIYDEYDPQTALVEDLGGGRYRVDARLPIDDLNDRFGTAAEPEADSVGGLFTELAGHIPNIGESVEVEGLRLIVEAREGARIIRLIVEPAPPGDPEEG